MAKKCKAGIVRFKTKRGKTIQFRGHTGSDCGPRPKPKTGHLSEFKKAMKAAAPGCKRRAKGAKAYRHCIGNAIKSATPR